MRQLSAICLCVTALWASSALAEDSASSWKDLTDDTPRADFFYLLMQDKNRENGQPVPPADAARSFALGNEFRFPHDTEFDDTAGVPRSNTVFGIDISHYTGRNLNLTKLKLQNVRFVYMKATQGIGYKDALFSYYWEGLAALPESQRVLRGAYHFLSSSGDGVGQAKSFLRLIEESGGATASDMPPVLDLEWDVARGVAGDRWAGHTPDEIIQTALAWLSYVEEHGGQKKTPILYTTRSWWRERIGSEAKIASFGHYKIWIADYSASSRGIEVPAVPSGGKAVLWQFTENGKLDSGYGGRLDGSIYKGTEQSFLADFQLQ
ncbi:MAG TPA: GH25 family lysozyme [Dongiaceae bacterium]|nr:GH25 family lysozyme [Dongiaceae bacterium]